MDVGRVIRLMWMLVLTIWAIAAEYENGLIQKRDWRSEAAVVVVGLGWVLLLLRRLPVVADWQIVPSVVWLRLAGVAITVAGLVFALWARYHLGRNWDAYITLKKDHQLVRTGPYALVRHPIYSRFMLASIGTALAFGWLRCFIAAALVISVWTYKSGLEELFLIDHFGEQYRQYRLNVKRLIPFVW